MAEQDFVKYHLREVLQASIAESNGDEDLSRRLHAETRLRLLNMSDEELWELAKQTSCSPERPVELVYKGIKQAIEEHGTTASEWINDLAKRAVPDKEVKVADNILIIEGDPALRTGLTLALTEAGFVVANVPDYSESLLKSDEFKPDIVIMDEVLPGGDGMEVCYQLQSTFGIPVVLLGEDCSDEVWERVMEAEADLYLIKPFSYRVLVARIKAILRRYKGRQCDRKKESGRTA